MAIRHDGHDQQWTEAKGLKRAVLAIVLRAMMCFAIWAGLYYLAMPAINVSAESFGGRSLLLGVLMYGLPAGIVGIIFAWIMSRNMIDIAGMVSPIVTLLAVAAIWAAVYGATRLVWTFRPFDEEGAWWAAPITWISACVFATGFTIKSTMFDE